MTVESVQRKRLGQYFTGVRLARALAALCDASAAASILDPMVGSGDMLVACAELGSKPELIGGIELDDAAAGLCVQRAEGLAADVRIVSGSAFDGRSWECLPDAWDLVITNPPYVRYQLQSGLGTEETAVPSARQVRAGLLALLERSTALTERERELVLRIARSYSGLSDLAVPSWLLCASKVRQGGRLGMVVPDTWLSRDYAAPVLYVLRRLFEIECVVIDDDTCWFEESLVRTTLVVARRVEDKQSAQGPGKHLVVRVPSSAGTPQSVVGTAFAVDEPEQGFARWVRDGSHPATSPLSSRWSNESDLVELLRSTQPQWFTSSETGQSEHQRHLPEAVSVIIGAAQHSSLTDLAGLGWSVGQGLRTGANRFFYVERLGDGRWRSVLLPDIELELPDQVVRPAVRRQAELPKTANIVTRPQGAVLVLEGWALACDIPPECVGAVRPAQGDLARLIIAGENASIDRHGRTRRLPELSAVRTNVRPGRCWYHLPPITNRHQPELFLPRVNARNPRTFINGSDEVGGDKRRFAVDANFSTLWRNPSHPQALPPFALAALLSSSLAAAVLGTTGTVMGGGALKVEATHLRRVPLPRPRAEAVSTLVECGQHLARDGASESAIDTIDEVVAELIGVTARGTNALRSLRRAR
ncbi:N-6 DNA methylase [Candidatus Poriferisodalis sp.]|uniref:N-6 DNA methylase n=1 Tax=Candidatus Poriferisodalis sp. TaxID=3101277 RepID=UPI003B029A9D